jgi:hypothetical protein
MTRKLSEDNADLFQQTGRRGGQTSGKRRLETMTPQKRRERATKAAAVSAEARNKGATQQPPYAVRNQEASRNSIASRMDALILASQILNGLGAYTCKRSRKRNEFYPRDLNWIADVLLRVDAGERNPLRPCGE